MQLRSVAKPPPPLGALDPALVQPAQPESVVPVAPAVEPAR